MDATEQSMGPKNQIRIKTPKKNGRGTFINSNRSDENFDKYAGLLNPPPRATSLLNNQYRQNQQPPLLPLPNVSAIIHHQQPQLSRSLSSQGPSLHPSNRKNKSKDMSLTPKKSKPTKREEAKKRSATQSISEFLIVASDNRWGPDPKDLPVVLFSESVFNLSPPPSSLPLPKFFLRSKLSCNAEAVAAAGVDAGATNNLRRLLRLR